MHRSVDVPKSMIATPQRAFSIQTGILLLLMVFIAMGYTYVTSHQQTEYGNHYHSPRDVDRHQRLMKICLW